MPRILITAFEPYDRWSENASWLALVEFTKTLQVDTEITTRRYPVDFAAVRECLQSDLFEDYEVVVTKLAEGFRDGFHFGIRGSILVQVKESQAAATTLALEFPVCFLN